MLSCVFNAVNPFTLFFCSLIFLKTDQNYCDSVHISRLAQHCHLTLLLIFQMCFIYISVSLSNAPDMSGKMMFTL